MASERMCKSVGVDRARLSGVLFDWRGTLVCDPEEELWLLAAAARLGRELDALDIEALLSDLETASRRADLVERLANADCSAADHRAANLDLFRAAGMGKDLALQLYELDFDPDFHPFYPDVAGVFAALNERDVAIAIVSNIHFDLRPEFAAAGIDRFVDAYVLSFEHKMQKPDPAMFELALGALGLQSHDVLMVGDDPRRDGGAALVGIKTLLVPPLRQCVPRGLEAVLALTG
jgi:FMN phosphatase YigB (HAD superfamily)